jgi:hypothetical protein
MEWIKLNDEDQIEFVMEEVKLVPEVQGIRSLSYNKGFPGDADGRKKLRAKQELKYLYLAYSPKSPYKDYTETDRLTEARIDCNLADNWEESTELKLLVKKFNKGSLSKVGRLLETVTKFLEKFENHLNTIQLDERSATGGMVHDPKKILDTLNQLPRLASTIQELEQQVKYGMISNTKVKGDHELGWSGVNPEALDSEQTNED